jgi:cell wall-associated NlpC family hydrolase
MTANGLDGDFTNIDTALLNRYFREYYQTRGQGGTHTQQRNLIQLFNYLQREYGHPSPYAAGLNRYAEVRGRPKTLSPSFVDDLLEVTGGGKARDFETARDHAIIRILRSEGIRRQELLGMVMHTLPADLLRNPVFRLVPLKGARNAGEGRLVSLLNPVYAASAFYARLVQVANWQTLPLTVAAQDVQHSGFPGAYAQWESLADALVSTFSGTATACLTDDGGHVPASGAIQLPAGFALPPGTPATVQTAIAYAVAQLGKPYLWGGTGPAGFDCSGLVMMAYRAAGISIPRTTFQQVLAGTPVYGIGQLAPGDLLFSAGSDGTAADPGHVGMYIGSALVIEAPETGEPVMITPLAGYWQQNTVAIRRIV